MADTTPALPAGFKLDEQATTPPLPAGFQVDAPAQAATPTTPQAMPLGDQLKRSFGMASREVASGLSSLPDIIQAPYAATVNKAESVLGIPEKYRAATYNELAQAGLTKAGVPQYTARNAAERYAGAGERAMGAAFTGGPVSSLLKQAPGAITRSVGETLAANPGAQLRATVAGITAGQTAKEAKLPVAAQIAAEFLGGAAGGAGGLRDATAMKQLTNEFSKSIGQMTMGERQALVNGVKEGLVIPPAYLQSSKVGSMLQGAGGKAQTNQLAMIKNETRVDQIVGKDIGINGNITPAAIAQAKQTAYKAYQAIQDLPTPFTLHQDFKRRINDLGADLEATARKYPGIVDVSKIKELRSQLTGRDTMMPNDAVTLMKQLRADAAATFNRAYSAEKPSAAQLALGKAQHEAADTIEKMVATNLKKTGSVKLYQDFQEARRHLAKISDVEEAWNAASNHVDPKILHRINEASGGTRLTGGLKTVADFAGNFPNAVGSVSKKGGFTEVSPLDVGLGGLGVSIGHDPYYAALGLVKPTVGYLSRRAALSPTIQQRLLPKEPTTP